MKFKMVICLIALITLLSVAAVVKAAHSDYGCSGCHTPHKSESMPQVPLWNGSETTKVFDLYSSESLDAVVGQPEGSAKLCLSCHDGSYALLAGSYMDFGSDLSTSHPISFVYDSGLATADGGLKDPGENSTLGGTIAEDLLDSAGMVQCISCHDIHSSGVGDHYLRGYDYFHGFNGGDMCRMCHVK